MLIRSQEMSFSADDVQVYMCGGKTLEAHAGSD